MRAGLLSQEAARETQTTSANESITVTRTLVRAGLISARQLADFVALSLGVTAIDLNSETLDPDAVACVDERIARRYECLPLHQDGWTLTVAMTDPVDSLAIQVLNSHTGMVINPLVATINDVQENLDLAYRVIENTADTDTRHGSISVTSAPTTFHNLADSPPPVILDQLLFQAAVDRASDIHISATPREMRLRFRIDGILHEVLSLPLELHPALISRIKIMAGLNIAERRRPQDGQFNVDLDGREIDVRVAISSTSDGEMAVLRLLDKSFTLIGLEQIGMSADHLGEYRKWLKLPYGMIVVCGPTGAGKSTSLYASIMEINRSEKHIVTLEDPVEYAISDANQMQVHADAGVTFAGQLRSVLRLDPDVILVGEIRDEETAQIAAQAALTGHLVLTSLHASDSLSALFRLKDLKIPPYLIASSVAGITSQRMVRVVCNVCGEQVARPVSEQEAYLAEIGERRTEFFYGKGCNACAHTGYHGRTGVFEILGISDEMRALFLNDASREELAAQARIEGMRSLRRDAMLKVKDGVTTPYEVVRTLFSLD